MLPTKRRENSEIYFLGLFECFVGNMSLPKAA